MIIEIILGLILLLYIALISIIAFLLWIAWESIVLGLYDKAIICLLLAGIICYIIK